MTLTEAELAALPAHPSGQVKLSDNDLGGVAGGEESTERLKSWGCCHLQTFNTFPCNVGTLYVPIFSYGCCKREVDVSA